MVKSITINLIKKTELIGKPIEDSLIENLSQGVFYAEPLNFLIIKSV